MKHLNEIEVKDLEYIHPYLMDGDEETVDPDKDEKPDERG